MSVEKPTKQKVRAYLDWRNNEQLKTFWGFIADRIMIPTVYQPIASANNSIPYIAKTDNAVSEITEIPDLAAKKTTGYILPTPSKPSTFLNKTSIKQTANSIKNYVASKVTSQVTKTVSVVKAMVQTVSKTVKNVYNTAKNKIGSIFR